MSLLKAGQNEFWIIQNFETWNLSKKILKSLKKNLKRNYNKTIKPTILLIWNLDKHYIVYERSAWQFLFTNRCKRLKSRNWKNVIYNLASHISKRDVETTVFLRLQFIASLRNTKKVMSLSKTGKDEFQDYRTWKISKKIIIKKKFQQD